MRAQLSQTLVASMAILGLGVLSGTISARMLGPSQKGVVTAAILWPVVLAGAGGLGLLDAIVYFAARGRPRSEMVLGTGVAILVVISGLAILIGYPLIAALLGGHSPAAVTLAQRSLICVPLILLGTAFASVVIGTGATTSYNIIRCTQPAALGLGTLALITIGRLSAASFVLVTILAYAAACATAFAFCVSAIGIRWRVSLLAARAMMVYGMKSHPGHIASMMNLQFDQVMMSALLQSSVLGVYAVAASIGGGVALLSGAAAIASFAALAGEADDAQQLEMFGRVARAGLGLAAVVAAALWVAAPRIITLLFGASYAEAIAPTRLLLIAAVPLAFNTILSSGFKALNRAVVPTIAQIISLAATLILLPFLLPRYQALGAAATSLLAYSVTTVYLLVAVRRHSGLTPHALLRPRLADWQWLARSLSWRPSP